MNLKFDKKTLRKIILAVVGIIVFYWLLHEPGRVKSIFGTIRNILAPFIVGGVLAFILNVPMRAFERILKGIKRNKLQRICALLLTLLCAVIILALVFVLLIPELSDSMKQLLPKLQETFDSLWSKITAYLEKHPELKGWFDTSLNLEFSDKSSIVNKILEALGSGINLLVPQAVTAIGSFISALANAFIGIAFSIYALFQKETLARQGRKILYAVLPEKTSDYLVSTLRLTNSTFSNFLSGQCVEVCILGSMFAIAMIVFRMPYAALVSVLVAVTAFIPVVGAWIGCAVGAFLIFVNNPIQAVWFVILFVVLQAIENNFIYPRVAGNAVGLPGMWVLISITVGGKLMGIFGMFLMIPITSVLYVIIRDAVVNRLSKRHIDSDKLQPRPPELNSRPGFKLFGKRKKKVKK